MAAAAEKKKVVKKSAYEVKDGKISRKNQSCPKCGEGTLLAEHKNRLACGKCGYTRWKN